MQSLVNSYQYDIFISYRHNDNRSGWVTDFVKALQEELAATIKEPLSIYFDKNPHDGLLETHNVDKSLEGKLKCLIFIPIISQTYCDPKSFAWQHEFVAFNKLAHEDQFGRDIKLSNRNVASRILPIKIHDLDLEDTATIEKEIGGVLRAIEFIFKTPGVNRPLLPNEEHPHDNQNKLFYRDQINKAANAIKEIISALRNPTLQATSTTLIKEEVKKEKKIPAKQVGSLKESTERDSGVKKSRKVILYALTSIFLLVSIYVGYNWFDKKSKVKWARTEVLPQIDSAVESGDINWETYELIKQAQAYIPDDPELKKLIPRATRSLSFISDPPGAEIYGKDYSKSPGEWILLGKTPIKNIMIPRNQASKFKLELDGYETSEQPFFGIMFFFGVRDISVKFHRTNDTPSGMVYIKGDTSRMRLVGFDHLPEKVLGDFWIDKFEVTNKEYKAFIDKGGYQDKKYWKHTIIDGSKVLNFDEAMNIFKDKTGVRGPANWEAGSYPDGQEDFPVGGLSWYEAAAYAEFVGKELPSIYHWNYVANTYSSGAVVPISNMGNNKPLKVGESGSMNTGGTYDLSGNVREWIFNKETKTGDRFILGGGWDDAAYAFTDAYSLPPLSRSVTNGIRCILPIDTAGQNILMAELENPTRDFSKLHPIDESMFNLLTRQYAYDMSELEPTLIAVDSSNEYWIKQKVEINAAYGNERIPVYLFLPRNAKPPFQTTVMFPGDGGFYDPSSTDMNIPDYIPKSGRALVIPVYKSIYERRDDLKSSLPNMTNQYKEHVIMWSKDIMRTVDYLELRKDIDMNKLAYLGFSWGGRLGPIMMYTEKRFKIGILTVAGLRSQPCLPEADPFNFLPRVKIPVLMLNGEYDFYFPVESSQRPLFENLGTPKEDKLWKLYDRSHQVPRTELAKESIAWMNKYLGPVR